MNELERLKDVLKNSFAGIKKDMMDLKLSQEQQLMTAYQVKQEMERVKEDYISKDKFNALKIKIAELNDSLKKLWDIESEIKKLEDKTASKSLLDTELIKTNATVTKKVAEVNDAVEKIREQLKQYFTKPQIKEFLNDVNNEFNAVHKELSEVRSIKEAITRRELESKSANINARIDLLAKEVLNTNKKLAQCPTNVEMEVLVSQLNAEFDDMKKHFAEFEKIKKYMKFLDDETVRKNDLTASLARISEENAQLRKEFDNLKNNAARQKDLERFKEEMRNLVDGTKMEISDAFVPKKEHSKVMKEEAKEIKASLKLKAIEQPYRKTNIFGNILIAATFVFLAVGVVSYFTIDPTYTPYFAFAAIATFIVGLLMKIIVAVKRK